MATQGVDVRQTTGQLILRALLLDSSGDPVTSGTTTLRLAELQDDGTLLGYDFNDNTFKSGTATTPTVNMTHRTINGAAVNTGVWTYELETLTDFNEGQVYLMIVNNTSASPPNQVREFQFGNAQGDLTVTAARLNTNANAISESTTAADRLEASLNASAGIDLNLVQTLDTTPTNDTVGDALWNAAESLPEGILPGQPTGLPRVDDLSASDAFRLVSTTMQASSTTTALVAAAADLPTTPTDDIYNDLILIAYDNSAGDKPNVRFVSDFDASSSTFTLSAALDFTPEIGVDTFEILVVTTADSTVTTELLKLTTGFSASNPNNLNSYLKSMMSTAATVPSGVGTYDPSTDALEALRGRLDLITGAGFSTGTDSLAAIRDAIDDLIAPVVVTGSGASGIGFLSDCITRIRRITDEPTVVPKYTNADIIDLIHDAFDQTLATINIDTDNPIMVRFDVAVVNGTQEYVLPCNVAEIWRVAKIDSTTTLPTSEVWPTNEYSIHGDGFTIEGNILRLRQPNYETQTLQVLYIPSGGVSIHTATAASGSTTTIVFPASPTDGALDIRPYAYNGYTVRILQGTGAGQDRVVSSYDSGTRTATVRPDWTTAPDDTSVYEVLPQYSDMIRDVVCHQAALDILANEAKTQRRAEVERRLQVKMAGLRNTLGKKSRRFPGQGPGIDDWANPDIWPLVP